MSQDAPHQVPPDQDTEVHEGKVRGENKILCEKIHVMFYSFCRLSVKFQWRSRPTRVSPSLSPPGPSLSSLQATAQLEQAEVMVMIMVTPGEVTRQVIMPPAPDTQH